MVSLHTPAAGLTKDNIMFQSISYTQYSQVRNAARQALVDALGAKTLRDAAVTIADIGSRFGFDEEARPLSERTSPQGTLAEKPKDFNELINVVSETLLNKFFTAPLTDALDEALQVAVFYGSMVAKEHAEVD